MHHLLSAFLIFSLLIQNPANSSQAGSSQANKPVTLAQVWTLDATYHDAAHGVSFRYPSAWMATTDFAYHAPALKDSFAKPIAGFAYDGGFSNRRLAGPYSSTNLEGFGIVYSAVKAVSAAKCYKMAASLADSPKHSTVVLGGRSFREFETGEDGMSQSISGSLYASYAKHTCYLFETDLALASEAVLDDVDGLTTAQLKYIFDHLDGIMKTVEIAPGK
jgi:hypothetical protein